MSKFEIGQSFFVVADPRTGGTFLSHCLGSHPDVYCHRREVLHRRDVPRQVLRGISPLGIVRVFIEQQGWEACGVKLVYKELSRGIVNWAQTEGVKVIHLVRENAIRVALSRTLTSQQRQGARINYPSTRTEPGTPERTEVDPVPLIVRARKYVAAVQAMDDLLADSGLETTRVTYAEMIGGEGTATNKMERGLAYRLCEFLGIPKRTLTCRFHMSGSLPMRKMLSNWAQMRMRIENSELAYCLQDEDNWPGGGPKDADAELEEGEGPEPDLEPGEREPGDTGGGEPRPDSASPGDIGDVGPEPSPVAVE